LINPERLTLLPVIGLVQVGAQARADRYMYLPMIGLLIATAWSAQVVARRLRIETWFAVAAVASVATLSFVTDQTIFDISTLLVMPLHFRLAV
jgi:hypothetical protein